MIRPHEAAVDVEDRQVKLHLLDAGPADEAWLESLRRSVYAQVFEATWGGWDEERHERQFAVDTERRAKPARG
jgi:hypothetical protein